MDRCPFKVEPARTGRSKCKGCNEKIEKDALRLTITEMYYGRVFSKNLHIGCFDLYLKKELRNLKDYNAFETIEKPQYIEGWQKLDSAEKQSVLMNIYKMDVSVADIDRGSIPRTQLLEEREAELYEREEECEESNKRSFIKGVRKLYKIVKKHGFKKKLERRENDEPPRKKKRISNDAFEKKRELLREIYKFIEKNKDIMVDCNWCDGYDECEKCEEGDGQIKMDDLYTEDLYV